MQMTNLSYISSQGRGQRERPFMARVYLRLRKWQGRDSCVKGGHIFGWCNLARDAAWYRAAEIQMPKTCSLVH